MAVARAQIRSISKRLFSGISNQNPHPPPHCDSSPQVTDEKFSFLDAVGDAPSPWPLSDRNHWQIFLKKSCLKGATEEEKMDFYIKTAAKVFGSEEEAKKRIYKVTRDCSFDGFGIEMGWNGWDKFRGLHSVVEWVDPEYAGPMYFNGQMVRWSWKPKSRERGRFPLPNPDLHSDIESGTDSDYD